MNTAATLSDMTDAEYFADSAIDQSQIKQFLRNPANWGWSRLNHTDKATDAMRFGTAFHAYLLETAEIVSLPAGETFQKKANREWKAQQEAEGKIVVTDADMRLLKRMRAGIADRPEFMDQIANGMREQAIFWTDQKTGLRLKAKLDLIPRDSEWLVDLKTTKSAKMKDFARTSLDHGYHIQAEFYGWAVSQIDPALMGRQKRTPKGMQFWAFEKSEACDFQPFKLSHSSQIAEIARMSIRQGLNGIARYVKLGEKAGLGEGIDAAAKYAITHGYSKVVEEIEFPDWALRDAEKMI